MADKSDSTVVGRSLGELRDRQSSLKQIKELLGIKEEQSNLIGFLFLIPNIVVFTAFMLLPVLFAIFLAFNEWSMLSAEAKWVGLDNFRDIMNPAPWEDNWAALREPTVNTWWYALRNSAIYTIAVVPIQIYAGLMFALLLDRRVYGKKWFRAMYFFPYMIAPAVAAAIWRWHLGTTGVINYFLEPFALNHNWAGDPSTALWSIVIIGAWIGIGFNMVLFLAGLQNIPEELYEAARIDGATQWKRFREVTWPNLANTTFFVIIMAVIFSFQVFSIAWVFGEGGPNYATTTAVVRIYQLAFQQGQMGLASAMSLMLFALLFVFSYYQYRIRSAEEVEF